MEPKIAYALGQRDTIAGIFAEIEAYGVEAALEKVAKQYSNAFDDKNPFVEKFLSKNKETKNEQT